MTLPRHGSWFEGHFPGNPILPGVAHLALLGRPIGALRSLRLRAPLLPGDEVAIEASGPDDRKLGSASIRKGGVEASRFAWEEPADPEAMVEAEAGARPTDEGEDPSPWLPHRPPIRSVERLLAHDGREATCAIRLPTAGAFVARDRVPSYFSLECAAQATAALEASRRRVSGGQILPRLGYLVGARAARFGACWLPAGARGSVRVALEAHAGPLAVYVFELELGGRQAASGTIQVWITATDA